MVFNLFKFLIPLPRGRIIRDLTRTNVVSDWQNIDILLTQKGPSQLKQALISADKALDNVLKDKVSGETMGERLKNARDLYDRELYNKIWQSHKMRNSLVHESGYEPPYHMLISGVETFRTAIKKLGLKL